MSITVKTQAELDSALASLAGKFGDIEIRSPQGVWLTVAATGSATVGGVIIDVSKPMSDPAGWADYHGVKVSKAGVATVYKAVNDAWTTDYGFDYSPGAKPSAPDWRDDNECGGGLHFSPTPTQALAYNPEATKFLAVGVKLADLRPIPGGTAKCKAPKVVRACVEVDIDGQAVAR
jgi:hypothetical protein